MENEKRLSKTTVSRLSAIKDSLNFHIGEIQGSKISETVSDNFINRIIVELRLLLVGYGYAKDRFEKWYSINSANIPSGINQLRPPVLDILGGEKRITEHIKVVYSILTFIDDLLEYNSKLDELSKKNIEIEKKDEKIIESEQVIINIGDKRTEELKKGFEDLKQAYEKEERKWLLISITIFIVLITSAFLPILFAIGLKGAEKIVIYFIIVIFAIIYAFLGVEEGENIQDEYWFEKIVNNNKTARIIVSVITFFGLVFLMKYTSENIDPKQTSDFNKLIPFLPFEVISLTFLYFCVYQFSKAKNLRIEQQNKISVVSGYQALIAQEELTGKEVRLSYFLSNISDVLFCKVNDNKDQNLPIDKIIEAANLINNVNKK